MSKQRPLLLASAVTAIVATLVFAFGGLQSPFRTADPTQEPVADLAAAEPTPTPEEATSAATEEATAEATVTPTARPPKAKLTSASRTKGSSGGSPATPRPTARHTPAPTAKPKPKPTPKPTPRPTAAPAADAATLAVGVSGGNPVLSWSTCSSDAFAAYAVVRSTDNEIHFPAEDHDTVVAMVTSRDSTRLTDSGAASGTRVWYRVWCVSRRDGEYKSIWRTPTVSVTP